MFVGQLYIIRKEKEGKSSANNGLCIRPQLVHYLQRLVFFFSHEEMEKEKKTYKTETPTSNVNSLMPVHVCI
jgi:hypothetical protein